MPRSGGSPPSSRRARQPADRHGGRDDTRRTGSKQADKASGRRDRCAAMAHCAMPRAPTRSAVREAGPVAAPGRRAQDWRRGLLERHKQVTAERQVERRQAPRQKEGAELPNARHYPPRARERSSTTVSLQAASPTGSLDFIMRMSACRPWHSPTEVRGGNGQRGTRNQGAAGQGRCRQRATWRE